VSGGPEGSDAKTPIGVEWGHHEHARNLPGSLRLHVFKDPNERLQSTLNLGEQ
jgi:hypothetical protein